MAFFNEFKGLYDFGMNSCRTNPYDQLQASEISLSAPSSFICAL